MKFRRLQNNPIIWPGLLAYGDSLSINGASLIRAPEWLPNRLGNYYLYFSHHKGTYIRLAYADVISGPWTIFLGGTLQLFDTPMCRGHIASPDVHVDDAGKKIRMYFHGPTDNGIQKTFIAISSDGIHYEAYNEMIGGAYLRMVRWQGEWIGMAMDGYFYRSKTGISKFIRGSDKAFVITLNNQWQKMSLRHLALNLVNARLEIYYTMRGDAPERIWRCQVDVSYNWEQWCLKDHEIVLYPLFDWEGVDLPIAPSRKGMSMTREHALRDPAIFVDHGQTYLLYSVAGECGIAIAHLSN